MHTKNGSNAIKVTPLCIPRATPTAARAIVHVLRSGNWISTHLPLYLGKQRAKSAIRQKEKPQALERPGLAAEEFSISGPPGACARITIPVRSFLINRHNHFIQQDLQLISPAW